jgi:valyl-tRNA synthetase
MVAAFPEQSREWIDTTTEREMAFVQHVINSIRNIRGELTVPPSKEINLIVNFQDGNKEETIKKYQNYFLRLARVTTIERLKNGQKPKHAASSVVDGGEVFIPLEGIIDLDAERERIQKEIVHLQGMLESTQKKLANESFVGKAPKEVVDKEREKMDSFKANLDKLQKNLERLRD